MSTPSELKLSKTWDICIERTITRTVVASTIAGLASVVLFRSGSKRLAFLALGAGFGLGSSWTLNSIDFENEKKQLSK